MRIESLENHQNLVTLGFGTHTNILYTHDWHKTPNVNQNLLIYKLTEIGFVFIILFRLNPKYTSSTRIVVNGLFLPNAMFETPELENALILTCFKYNLQ